MSLTRSGMSFDGGAAGGGGLGGIGGASGGGDGALTARSVCSSGAGMDSDGHTDEGREAGGGERSERVEHPRAHGCGGCYDRRVDYEGGGGDEEGDVVGRAKRSSGCSAESDSARWVRYLSSSNSSRVESMIAVKEMAGRCQPLGSIGGGKLGGGGEGSGESGGDGGGEEEGGGEGGGGDGGGVGESRRRWWRRWWWW